MRARRSTSRLRYRLTLATYSLAQTNGKGTAGLQHPGDPQSESNPRLVTASAQLALPQHHDDSNYMAPADELGVDVLKAASQRHVRPLIELNDRINELTSLEHGINSTRIGVPMSRALKPGEPPRVARLIPQTGTLSLGQTRVHIRRGTADAFKN